MSSEMSLKVSWGILGNETPNTMRSGLSAPDGTSIMMCGPGLRLQLTQSVRSPQSPYHPAKNGGA